MAQQEIGFHAALSESVELIDCHIFLLALFIKYCYHQIQFFVSKGF